MYQVLLVCCVFNGRFKAPELVRKELKDLFLTSSLVIKQYAAQNCAIYFDIVIALSEASIRL